MLKSEVSNNSCKGNNLLTECLTDHARSHESRRWLGANGDLYHPINVIGNKFEFVIDIHSS